MADSSELIRSLIISLSFVLLAFGGKPDRDIELSRNEREIRDVIGDDPAEIGKLGDTNVPDTLVSRSRIDYSSMNNKFRANWGRKYNQDLYKEISKLQNSGTLLRHYEKWMDYKKTHDKKYADYAEEKRRFLIFADNSNYIEQKNNEYNNRRNTYGVQHNAYSDMSHEEFVKTMNGFRITLKDRSNDNTSDCTKFLPPLNFRAPYEVDWREQGYVTAVKNQGHCGSCWAFSATGSLEGQHKRQTGTLVSLSEQNLVDCSSKFGNEGCNGGLMDNAYKYIKQNGGIDTERSYPYEAKEGKCRYKKANIGAEDRGYIDLEPGNETELMVALASQGPISVAMDAGHRSFQFYRQGIYYEPNCSSVDLDHGVLAVGYGTVEDGHDYWLIKNSWGTTWGEDGYLRIARNRRNQCGIASQASYPAV